MRAFNISILFLSSFVVSISAASGTQSDSSTFTPTSLDRTFPTETDTPSDVPTTTRNFSGATDSPSPVPTTTRNFSGVDTTDTSEPTPSSRKRDTAHYARDSSKRDTAHYARVSSKRDAIAHQPRVSSERDITELARGNEYDGFEGAALRKRVLGTCAHKGQVRCPAAGGFGTECVSVQNDLESCGGCSIPDMFGFVDGMDCTALEGVDDVRCVRGTCQIRSCAAGYKLAHDPHNLSGGVECVEPEA